MPDASPEVTLGLGQAADFFGQNVHHVGLRVRTAVGQDSVEVIPYAFVGIQFGRIGGERDQMKTASARQKFLHGLSSVDIAVVQQDDQMAAHLTQQMAKEERDFLALDVVFVELTVQGAVKDPGTDCDSRDGGHPVMAIVIRQEGRLSHRTPSATNRGNQEEPGFIDEDDMGAQPRRVFFTAGHTSRFHASMAASSRSRARVSGFCGLQCNWCRSLPT